VDYIWGKKGEVSKPSPMALKCLWDDFFLYLGYEVRDANLIAVPIDDHQGPKDNRRQSFEIWVNPPQTQTDVAEFFIMFEDEQMFWEIHHNAANQLNDVLCIVNHESWKKNKPAMASWGVYFGRHEYIRDEGEHKLAKAVVLKPRADGEPSTVNDEKDTDTGYVGELRLPWLGIGAPARAQTKIVLEPRTKDKPEVSKPGPWKMAGRELSILAIIQDGDAEHRYHTTSPSLVHGAFFHHGVKHYPRYRLVDD